MRIRTQILAVFIVALVTMLWSCSDKKDQLLKTWRIVDLKYEHEVSEQMKPAIQRQVDTMKSNFSLTYLPDGSYVTRLGETEMKGTWKLNWNSSKMTSVGSDGVPKDFKIVELTDNKFVFETLEAKEVVTFVMEAEKK